MNFIPVTRARRHGFNLVEAAIVLGVVGLVIGGIWIAASAVQRNNRQQELLKTLVDAQTRVESMWKDLPQPCCGITDLTPGAYGSETLLPESAMPANIQAAFYYTDNSYRVKQLSSGIYFSVLLELIGGPGMGKFFFRMGPLDRADCLWLGRRVFSGSMYPAYASMRFNVGNTDGVSGGINYVDRGDVADYSYIESSCAPGQNVVVMMLSP